MNGGVLYSGFRNREFGFFTEKWEGEESEENRDFGKYEGEIKNGKQNGQGTQTFEGGNKYVGEMKDGFRNGQGIMTFHDGMKYVGEWKNGQSWNGTYYDNNGNFKHKVVNGEDTITDSNGDKFVGDLFEDGDRWNGTYTWSGGEKYVGEYWDNKEWNGTSYDKNGNITEKWVNGKRQ